jgi:predicted DCC family thiol-disulfide oxidoreductase YuxK
MLPSLFEPVVQRLTVLYDDDCGLCRWTADRLRAMDRRRRLELIPLQHAGRHAERPELARLAAGGTLTEQIHVVRDDGRIRAGGAAMLEILDALPGGRILRPWTRLPGVARIVEAVYRRIARNRAVVSRLLYRSGRVTAVCDLPH